MKISILFMCLLAVAYATYTEPKGYKDFCRHLECCSDKLGCQNIPYANIIDVNVWYCILQKAGVIKNNIVDKSKSIAYCKSIIMDQDDVKSCETQVDYCMEDGCSKIGPHLHESNYPYCLIMCMIKSGVINTIKQCYVNKRA